MSKRERERNKKKMYSASISTFLKLILTYGVFKNI